MHIYALNSKERIKHSIKERNILLAILTKCRETQKHSERDFFRKCTGLRNHLFRNETKSTLFGEQF